MTVVEHFEAGHFGRATVGVDVAELNLIGGITEDVGDYLFGRH